MGSMLVESGGFSLPFLIWGGLALAVAIVLIFALPNSKLSQELEIRDQHEWNNRSKM